MNVKRIAATGLSLAVACGARATPYWVGYEGDDFPENVGWTRTFGDENGPQHGGAARSLLDGVLRLDSSRNSLIYDYYEIDRPIDPGPSELFLAEWRLRVDEQSGPLSDVGITIARDQQGTLALRYFTDHVVSDREGWSLPITPQLFHDYRISSTDMVHYSFFIDGTYARDGLWDLNSLNQSFVNFGDGGFGGNVTSISDWDYFRFGVVPEPALLALWALGAVCAIRRVRS